MEVNELNKKVLVIALALAMLALPVSTVFAAKPDKFESFTFYGGPDYTAPMDFEYRMAGKSDNHFVIWNTIEWTFSWTMGGSEVFASGEYTGYWVQHGYEPIPPPFGTHTAQNYHGVYKMTVTDWNGEEGYLIIKMVAIENPSGKSGSKLTVLDGMIGDMKVHGTGTGANLIPALVYQYDLQLHLAP